MPAVEWQVKLAQHMQLHVQEAFATSISTGSVWCQWSQDFVQSSNSSAGGIRQRQICRVLQSCRLAEAGQSPPRALQAALLQRLVAAGTQDSRSVFMTCWL